MYTRSYQVYNRTHRSQIKKSYMYSLKPQQLTSTLRKQATTKTKRGQREKGDNPSKRGSSLDQTHSSGFAGQKEEGENHPGDDHGA